MVKETNAEDRRGMLVKGFFILSFLSFASCATPNLVSEESIEIGPIGLISMGYFEECLWKHGISKKEINDEKYQGKFTEVLTIHADSRSFESLDVIAENPSNQPLFSECAKVNRDEVNSKISSYFRAHPQKGTFVEAGREIISGEFHPFSGLGYFEKYPGKKILEFSNFYFDGFTNGQPTGAWSRLPK